MPGERDNAPSASYGVDVPDESREEADGRGGLDGRRLLPRRRRDMLLDVGTGALTLAVYAVAQIALLQGPHPFDSARYFRTAIDFPDVPVDLFTLRIGLVGPVTVAVRLLGHSEAALYAVPLASGLLLAAAVYATMLLLFGERLVAASAALVSALNTSYLLNSSHIFPDVAATATFTAGFFWLVLGARRAARGSVAIGAALVAGFFFGWTVLIREFSPAVLLPAVVLALVVLRYPLPRVAALAGGALATASLAFVYGLVRYGEPFLHTDALRSRAERSPGPAHMQGFEHIQEQLETPLDALVLFPRLLVSWRSGWAVLVLVVLFFAALAIFRDRRLWVLAAWAFSFWAIMAALALVTLPSGRWVINTTNIRYWYPVLPPLAMGGFAALTLIVRRYLRAVRGVAVAGPIAVAAAALVLVPGVVEYSRCAERDVWRSDPRERWHELRSWLGTADAARYEVIWTDRHTYRLAPAFMRTTFGEPVWEGSVMRFRREQVGKPPPGDPRRALVLIHRDRTSWPLTAQASGGEDFRRRWSPVFVTGDGRMIVAAHDSTVPTGAVDDEWAAASAARARAVQPGSCGVNPYMRRR